MFNLQLFNGLLRLVLCFDNLVAWWQDTFTTDKTKLKDKSTSATHEAVKAQYLDIDTPYTITFAGMVNGVTLTSHGGTATVDLTNGTLTCSVAGTLFDMVLSDGTQYACAEGEGIALLPNDSGEIEGLLVGFTLPGDRVASSITGSSRHNAVGWSEDVTDGVEYWSGSPDLNSATNNGDGSFTIDSNFGSIVDGVLSAIPFIYTTTFTISGYVSGSAGISPVTTSGGEYPNSNGTHTIIFTNDGSQPFNFVLDSSVSGVTFSDVSVERLLQGIIPASLTTPTQDIYGNALTYSGKAQQNLLVEGYVPNLAGIETLTLAHLTGSETITTQRGTSTVATVSGGLTFTAGTISYLLLSDGTELIFEGINSVSDTQITVYNIDGTGRHGTFVGGTTPLFTEAFTPSYLAQDGGHIDGINVVPYGATSEENTFDGIHNAPADIFNVNAPETLEIYNADDTNIFLDAITGLAKNVDPFDIPENTGDKILSSDNGITVADPAQTGDCLEETEKWHGI